MCSRIAAGLVATLLVQQPLFHVDTRLVVVRATVQNTRGELVTNLERDAFTVYENGKPQPITLFGREDVPVSIGLLIDNSGSMRPLRAQVEAAALVFARASNPRDEMFVVNFADRPTWMCRSRATSTCSKPGLRAATQLVEPRCGTQ
jgi:VWFA-related protein